MLVNPKCEQVSCKFNTYTGSNGYTLHKQHSFLIDVQVPNVPSLFFI